MSAKNEHSTDKVQVEISSHLFSHLLDSGLLHSGDCKCLNANAKSVIWHSLLASSYSGSMARPTNTRGEKLCA